MPCDASNTFPPSNQGLHKLPRTRLLQQHDLPHIIVLQPVIDSVSCHAKHVHGSRQQENRIKVAESGSLRRSKLCLERDGCLSLADITGR
jgi:hypothetical protein